ncbi:unnamed protein product, partial [Scytosiphon promiscuus]
MARAGSNRRAAVRDKAKHGGQTRSVCLHRLPSHLALRSSSCSHAAALVRIFVGAGALLAGQRMAHQQQHQQHQPASRPTSPPLSVSPPPGQPLIGGASSGQTLQQQAQLQAAVAAASAGAMARREGPRRASMACDGDHSAAAAFAARAEGTRKGRFQIREVRASIAEGVTTAASLAALKLQDDDEHAIAIVQDGKLVPSPLSTPRARARTQTEGDAGHHATVGSDGNIEAVANAVAAAAVAAAVSSAPGMSGFGSTGGITSMEMTTTHPFSNAPAGALASATATAVAAGGEPMKRQRGRFKLRDIREVSTSTSTSTSSSSSSSSSAMTTSTSQTGGVAMGSMG